ncbi:MAG: precorrin-8X methylmutase [Pseudanabaenaceae cyanobacterium SKYGB_i_bin29]|nr:precorrin-8X methylmutase [Pseudanabaenaceae cyanobacterium SKYG29]MDW8420673.1 precorrin-8X methylmutase [Pseudanabaenaceae cyanobacterium SKYGB_i_bin29]
MDYLRDGAEIYRRSFATIRAETDLSHLPPALEPIVVRLIHSCGMPDIVQDLAYGGDVATIGKQALQGGSPILCDSEMVAQGINKAFLPAQNQVICTLHHPRVPELAKRLGNTRSAVAVDLWREYVAGSVIAIGNAPTALFRLLELLAVGYPRPAVILGFPVGFVGAAEAKQALAENPWGIPFLTLHGRRGGSSLAVAAVNGLALA